MLSLPDFKQKKIIFIESKDLKKLSLQNENLTIKEDEKIIQQNPFHSIFVVFIIGECTLSSRLLKKITQYGVMIHLLDFNLQPYLSFGGETEGNFLLRQKQYNDDKNFLMAKWLMQLKINNQLSLLKQKRNKDEKHKIAIQQIKELHQKISSCQDEQSLLGIEGSSAKIFFKIYFSCCDWQGRKPRSKCDENNVLLDIGYTYLFNFIESQLRLYGFDVYKGFYHNFFWQRKSLVCDLMEVFRCLIDKVFYKMYALKQFDKNDFELKKNCFQLKRGNKKYSKIFLQALMNEKENIFCFIQKYYRAVMQEKEIEEFPIFEFN